MSYVQTWIVTCVDYYDQKSDKAQMLGSFKSEDLAKQYVKHDMDMWFVRNHASDINIDYDKMSITFSKALQSGCEWQIHKVNIHQYDNELSAQIPEN